MGLIDLKTNLKSLPYGDFKQPSATIKKFLKDSIQSNYVPIPYLGHGYDGFVRGGLVDRVLNLEDDSIRITDWLSTQNGKFFPLKELGLQKMNPRLEYGNDETRKYVFTNTLAQVGIGDAGHLYRHGGKITFDDKKTKYFDYIRTSQFLLQFFDNTNVSNRLVKLYQNLIVKNPNERVIDRYNGGGNSILGVGETVINRTSFSDEGSTTNAWSRKTLEEKSNVNPIGAIREDFRKYILPSTDGQYDKYNLKSRIGLGNSDDLNKVKIFYGKQGLQESNYNKQLIQNGTSLQRYKVGDKIQEIRDIVKLRIEIVDNNNPSHGNHLVFRAILSPITDTYNSSWSDVEYNNRSDNFHVYQKTNRTLSFNFKVVAESKSEMKVMYQKLNSLAASMFPDYTEFKMRGTFVRVTLGDYLNDQFGFITSLTYVTPDDATWEIALNAPEGGTDSDMYELPKLIDCSINFTPIHNFLPQNSLWRSKFILPILDSTEVNTQKWLSDLKLLENNTKFEAPMEVAVVTPTQKKDFTEFSLVAVQNSSNYLKFINGA